MSKALYFCDLSIPINVYPILSQNTLPAAVVFIVI